MDPNLFLWERIARDRYEELLRHAEAERRIPRTTIGSSMGRLMILAGRWLEQVGERLTAKGTPQNASHLVETPLSRSTTRK